MIFKGALMYWRIKEIIENNKNYETKSQPF